MAKVAGLGSAKKLLVILEKALVQCETLAAELLTGPGALYESCSALEKSFSDLEDIEKAHELGRWTGRGDWVAILRESSALLRPHAAETRPNQREAGERTSSEAWLRGEDALHRLNRQIRDLVGGLADHVEVAVKRTLLETKNDAELILKESIATLLDVSLDFNRTKNVHSIGRVSSEEIVSQLNEARDVQKVVKRIADHICCSDWDKKGKRRAEPIADCGFETLLTLCADISSTLTLIAEVTGKDVTADALSKLRSYSTSSLAESEDAHRLRRRDTVISEVDSVFSHVSSASSATTVTIHPQQASHITEKLPQIELPPSVMSITKMKKKITVLAPIPGGPWECRAVLQYQGDRVEAVVLETTKKKSSRIVHKVTSDRVLPESSYPLPGESKYRLTFREPQDVTVSIFQKQKQLQDSLEYVFEAEDDYNAFQEIFFRHRLVGSMNIKKAKSNLGLLATLRNIRIWSELDVVGSDELLLTMYCNAVEKGPRGNITFKLSGLKGLAKTRRSKENALTLEFDPPVKGNEWLEFQFATSNDKEKFERCWRFPSTASEHRRRSISFLQLQALG